MKTDRGLSEIRGFFDEKRLRLTHQRLEIYRELAKAKDHPSAEDIHGRLKERAPTISLDTVYRTLSTFEHHGLISRLEVLDDRSRFDPNLAQHHHLVCVQCRSVQDFCWPVFDHLKLPERDIKEWGVFQSRHGEIRGMCRNCLAKSSMQSSRSGRG